MSDSALAVQPTATDPFYLRFYVGHSGQHGHEFLEFEYSAGRLRYANNSNYRNDSLIRKEVYLSPLVVAEIKRIVHDSEIVKEDDKSWPPRSVVGKQELEVRLGNDHVSFETAKIGSLVDVQNSDDPEGLRVFYYLVQDLKIFMFSLIALHFKIKPVRAGEWAAIDCLLTWHDSTRQIDPSSRGLRERGVQIRLAVETEDRLQDGSDVAKEKPMCIECN